MKKIIAFFLCVLIFVSPITTLVKADVVIGDNDESIITENATILGRKLALLESFSDLALSGVTDFTISNTNDVDSYLDYLWEEIDDAIESLSNGTGFTEISNSLKSKYFTNLVQYKDYINNRGNYLAQLLPSGNPTTTLLSTFFADNLFGKQYTEQCDLALDMFRSLSAFNNSSPTPNPDPNFDFLNNINNLFVYNYNGPIQDFYSFTNWQDDYASVGTYNVAARNYSYCGNFLVASANFHLNSNGQTSTPITYLSPIITAYVNVNQDESASITYSSYSSSQIINGGFDSSQFYCTIQGGNLKGWYTKNGRWNTTSFYNQNTFEGLSSALNYLYRHYSNINIYVNGEAWVIIPNYSQVNPTLDIDGFLKIFGNDYPQQYQLQPNTKIDYDELYQVIYNAIRDNLPISQGDINYYDSHDTIYSPTIINNYGDEEGDEIDLIDTILDYAVIPKFDTSIAQPMRQALTNGVVIMNNSITNVIPNEILLILGACFFLLLFAVVINRMIK